MYSPIRLEKIPAGKTNPSSKKTIYFWTAVTGVTIFNTFIYIAGHYTSAINLALIGTTSAPVFATILAVIFLKEHAGILRVTGMLICISGILFLLCRGNLQQLAHFRFGTGELLVLISAFSFAIYNTLVAKKTDCYFSPGFPFCCLYTWHYLSFSILLL